MGWQEKIWVRKHWAGCYRWKGERKLDKGHFVWVHHQEPLVQTDRELSTAEKDRC